ncbi:predicted protein [Streptomyces sp. SPB78]|nr:predicted protein [Streptomyces sp. SPB78]
MRNGNRARISPEPDTGQAMPTSGNALGPLSETLGGSARHHSGRASRLHRGPRSALERAGHGPPARTYP